MSDLERRATPDRRATPKRREAGRRLTDAIAAARALLEEADVDEQRADRMLKIAQVARMANVSPRTVWNDIAKGALRVEKTLVGVRHRVRVSIEEARRYASLN